MTFRGELRPKLCKFCFLRLAGIGAGRSEHLLSAQL